MSRYKSPPITILFGFAFLFIFAQRLTVVPNKSSLRDAFNFEFSFFPKSELILYFTAGKASSYNLSLITEFAAIMVRQHSSTFLNAHSLPQSDVFGK